VFCPFLCAIHGIGSNFTPPFNKNTINCFFLLLIAAKIAILVSKQLRQYTTLPRKESTMAVQTEEKVSGVFPVMITFGSDVRQRYHDVGEKHRDIYLRGLELIEAEKFGKGKKVKK
jgi:hypothetical protein